MLHKKYIKENLKCQAAWGELDADIEVTEDDAQVDVKGLIKVK